MARQHAEAGASTGGGTSGRNQSASLRRALGVLDFLAGPDVDSAGASLAELCQRTGFNKSTALRLLGPLAEARLVQQGTETRRWSLGPHTAYLGQMFLERLDLPSMAHPSLRQLSRLTGETAHMVVLEDTQVCYVDKVEATDTSVWMISRIGARQPVYCTGVGKCFLAFGDDALLERVIDEGLVPRTEQTITDPDALRLELDRIRAAGYAVDDVENEAHIRCVAAPVFGADGQVCAALSVAGPTTRVTEERVAELAYQVCAAAAEVTRQLGGTVDAPRPTD